jgi:hypothetical protein
MASPHLAKRRRLNFSPSDEGGEFDDDFVCYGMVSPTVLLHEYMHSLNSLTAGRLEVPDRLGGSSARYTQPSQQQW